MTVTTKTYKSRLTDKDTRPAGITGLYTVDYHKVRRYWYGTKVLLFVHNCPNRYWAKKAVNYWLKNKLTLYGWNQQFFDLQCSETMDKTEIIPFSDIAFGIGYKGAL
jgi:hypothetical protein